MRSGTEAMALVARGFTLGSMRSPPPPCKELDAGVPSCELAYPM
jgi:hypothetical protein